MYTAKSSMTICRNGFRLKNVSIKRYSGAISSPNNAVSFSIPWYKIISALGMLRFLPIWAVLNISPTYFFPTQHKERRKELFYTRFFALTGSIRVKSQHGCPFFGKLYFKGNFLSCYHGSTMFLCNRSYIFLKPEVC